MGSRTPLQGGILVAVLWILGQIVLWTVATLATAFLSLLLAMLMGGTLDPANWEGMTR